MLSYCSGESTAVTGCAAERRPQSSGYQLKKRQLSSLISLDKRLPPFLLDIASVCKPSNIFAL